MVENVLRPFPLIHWIAEAKNGLEQEEYSAWAAPVVVRQASPPLDD